MTEETAGGQRLAVLISQEIGMGFVRFVPGTVPIVYWQPGERTYAVSVQLDDRSIHLDATRAHIQKRGDDTSRVHLFEKPENPEDALPENILGMLTQAELILTAAFNRDVRVDTLIVRS
jgi:hypothetical protein